MTSQVDNPVTSPTLPTDTGIVRTARDFSGALTLELTDAEIAKAFEIVVSIRKKYEHLSATHENLAALGDEVVYTLAEKAGVLASFDPTPILNGEPPMVEFVGKVSGDSIHSYGLDHEKKTWEVQRAKNTGESFLGEEKSRSRVG